LTSIEILSNIYQLDGISMARNPNTEMREKILEVAFDLFYAGGLNAVSMEDIADKVGVKKANLFHYYHSKNDLILAVFDHGTSFMQEQILKRFCDTKTDPIQVFEGMFVDIMDCMKKNACSRGCFIGNLAQEMSDHHEVLRKRMSDFIGQWKACLTQYLKGWKSVGYFKKDFRPESAAEAILSAFEGSILFCKAEKKVSAVESTQFMVIHFLKSFKVKKCCPIANVFSCFSWKKHKDNGG